MVFCLWFCWFRILCIMCWWILVSIWLLSLIRWKWFMLMFMVGSILWIVVWNVVEGLMVIILS